MTIRIPCYFFAILLVSGVLGCSSPKLTMPEPVVSAVADSVPNDYCRIILRRKIQYAGAAIKHTISVNGLTIGKLSIGQSCTWKQALEGSIRIEADTYDGWHGAVEIVKPSHGIYVFDISSRFGAVSPGTNGLKIQPITGRKAEKQLAGKFRPEKWNDMKDLTNMLIVQALLRIQYSVQILKAQFQLQDLVRKPEVLQLIRDVEQKFEILEVDIRNWPKLRKGMTLAQVVEMFPPKSSFKKQPMNELVTLGLRAGTIANRAPTTISANGTLGTSFVFANGRLQSWHPEELDSP